MSQSAELTALFNAVVLELDFDKRYFGFIDNYPKKKAVLTSDDIEESKEILMSLGLEAKYNKRERFFTYTRNCDGGYKIILTIIMASRIDISIHLEKGKELAGGSFDEHAKYVARVRDPKFSRDLPWPKLPSEDPERMRDSLRFGVALFRDVEKALLTRLGLMA